MVQGESADCYHYQSGLSRTTVTPTIRVRTGGAAKVTP